MLLSMANIKPFLRKSFQIEQGKISLHPIFSNYKKKKWAHQNIFSKEKQFSKPAAIVKFIVLKDEIC